MKAKVLLVLVLISSLPSCSLFRDIRVENDIVRSSKRMRADFVYQFTEERYTPLLNITQSVVKEAGKDTPAKLTFYERIRLNANSFKLEDKVYVLVDDVAYPGKIEDLEFEREYKMEEKRKELMTVDSSKISVVTGVNNHENNLYRLTYSLDSQAIEQIKNCSKVRFRYYAGPDMITTGMSRFDLETFKMLISQE